MSAERCVHSMLPGLCVVRSCPHYDGKGSTEVLDVDDLPRRAGGLPPYLDTLQGAELRPSQVALVETINRALDARRSAPASIRNCRSVVLTEALTNALADSLELQRRAEQYALAELTRQPAKAKGAA